MTQTRFSAYRNYPQGQTGMYTITKAVCAAVKLKKSALGTLRRQNSGASGSAEDWFQDPMDTQIRRCSRPLYKTAVVVQ